MRCFRVWLKYGRSPTEQSLIELPDSATDEECEFACKQALDNMIASWIDTGREEIK